MLIKATTYCGDGPDVLVVADKPDWKSDFQQLDDGTYSFGLTADEALALAAELIKAAGAAKDFWHNYNVAQCRCR